MSMQPPAAPSIPRLARSLRFCLLLLASAGASAQAGVTPEVREWLSALVTRLAATEDATHAPQGSPRFVVVKVRIVVDADGALRDVSVERGSGSRRTDERALEAVRSAAPFEPPPEDLLTQEGTADLSLPMEMIRRR